MNCSTAREALSAWSDGEDAEARPLDVSRHLHTCRDCAAYAQTLSGLTDLTSALQRIPPGPVPRPREQYDPPRRARRVRLLCLALVVLTVAELVAALVELRAEHGYGGEDHAGHESLSFTLAVCVGLLWIAWRPAYARSYLPLVGVAAGLLAVTAGIDVARGTAELVDELPHLGFLLGFGLLWMLSHGAGDVPAPRDDAPPQPATPARPLRVVRGALRGAVLAGVPAVLLLAAPSFGHATLEGSTPGTGAVLARLPPTVTLHFDEPVTTLPTSLQVFAPDGSRADNGAVTHPGGAGADVAVGTSGHQRGTYLVSWRVVSADSHPVSGAFTFSVGTRTAAPTAPPVHEDRLVGGLLGGSRWLGYVGAALGVGGLAFLMVCWPAGWDDVRARRLVGAGLSVTVLAAVAALLLKGPDDAALGLSAMTHGSLLREVLGSTYGHAQVARLALVVVAAALLVRARRPSSPRLVALAVVGLGLLATYAASGHAVTERPRGLAFGADLVHVGAMSVWLGGLTFLLACVLRRAGRSEDAAGVARRFSAMALASVGLLVASGTYQAWREVRSWSALTATTYGRELLVKLALVVAVLGAAATSRHWVRSRRRDAAVLRRRVSLEAVGLALVLGLTSALVATEPARSAYHPSVSANLALGPDLVQVSAVPAGDRRMTVHLYVFDARQRPTEPQALSASVSLASADIGPLALRLQRVGRGHRVAAVAVPVAGQWRLDVDLRTSPIDEYTKVVTLPIR